MNEQCVLGLNTQGCSISMAINDKWTAKVIFYARYLFSTIKTIERRGIEKNGFTKAPAGARQRRQRPLTSHLTRFFLL